MALLSLVTIGFVRDLRGWGSGDVDQNALVTEIIDEVSQRFESALCGRKLNEEARTEQFTVKPGQRRFQLEAWPVDTGQDFEVKNDVERAFTGDAVAAGDYYINPDTGALVIETALEEGAGALQVAYTGGIGATASAVESNYPEIAGAVRKQVVYEYERRDSLGISSQAGGTPNARAWSKVRADGWLPEVWTVIEKYRRLAMV